MHNICTDVMDIEAKLCDNKERELMGERRSEMRKDRNGGYVQSS